MTQTTDCGTKWCDYIENILELITINSCNREAEDIDGSSQRMITTRPFPYHMCDIALLQCNTGQIACLKTRLKQYNRREGSLSTTPRHLGPFAIFAFICGFGGRRILHEDVECRWKVKRDMLIRTGINDVREWARYGEDIINKLDGRAYRIDKSNLNF
eukprot:8117535-Ditylum_brightwellii.AAC.1